MESRNEPKSRSRGSKAATIRNPKFSRRPTGFISAVSSRLDCGNPSNGKTGNTLLPDWVSPHPPLVLPLEPKSQGKAGSVPLPMSISWQRYTPEDAPDGTVKLTAIEEPNVLVIILPDKLKLLLCGDLNENVHFSQFSAMLRDLERPISIMLFAKPNQLKSAGFYTVMARLQLDVQVRGIQHVTTIEDLAVLVASYTKAIGQRPFKEGRIDATEGFTFLPATVGRGLISSAASTRLGSLKFPRRDLVCAGAQTDAEATRLWEDAVHAWVHRTWLSQLGQLRGVTGEVASAIAATYPTPRSLYNAIWTTGPSDGSLHAVQEKARMMLADLPIRRGAGVLETQNRLGNQLARRIATFFTSPDPFDEGTS